MNGYWGCSVGKTDLFCGQRGTRLAGHSHDELDKKRTHPHQQKTFRAFHFVVLAGQRHQFFRRRQSTGRARATPDLYIMAGSLPPKSLSLLLFFLMVVEGRVWAVVC